MKKAAHSDSIHFVTADSTDIPRIRADIFALTGYGIDLLIRLIKRTAGAGVWTVLTVYHNTEHG